MTRMTCPSALTAEIGPRLLRASGTGQPERRGDGLSGSGRPIGFGDIDDVAEIGQGLHRTKPYKPYRIASVLLCLWHAAMSRGDGFELLRRPAIPLHRGKKQL